MADASAKCVILCESVHDVMALERALLDAGLAVEMVPTPRELTSDCGMALELAAADVPRLAGLRESGAARYLGVYSRGPAGFQKLAAGD